MKYCKNIYVKCIDMFCLTYYICIKKGVEDMTLKEIRKMLHLSQKELAEKIGVFCVTVSNWEIGKRDPHFTELKKISELSGVSIDDMSFPYPNEKAKLHKGKEKRK